MTLYDWLMKQPLDRNDGIGFLCNRLRTDPNAPTNEDELQYLALVALEMGNVPLLVHLRNAIDEWYEEINVN